MQQLSSRVTRVIVSMLALFSLVACNDSLTTYEGVTIIPGSLTIRSQAELTHLDGVAQVLGSLTLSNYGSADPIRDLSPLHRLVYVGDTFSLSGISGVHSLLPLSNLEVVGVRLSISGLHDLQDLDGLQSLWGVGSTIEISNNSALESIEGLSGLEQMARGQIEIQGNPVLRSLKGLEGLRSLATDSEYEGGLRIHDCDGLLNLDGLDNLETLRDLTISNCEGLTDLSALSSLISVTHWFRLSRLPALEDLTGLESLEVCPRIILFDTPSLVSLETLAALEVEELGLTGTALLNLESTPRLVEGGDLDLNDNLHLQSLDGLATAGTLSSVNLGRNGALTSLTELVDTSVTSYIGVWACSTLVSLEGLESTTSLHSLSIRANDLLSSLDGLENLDSLTWNCTISDNPALCDTLIESFLTDVTVGGAITVESNASCGPPPAPIDLGEPLP